MYGSSVMVFVARGQANTGMMRQRQIPFLENPGTRSLNSVDQSNGNVKYFFGISLAFFLLAL